MTDCRPDCSRCIACTLSDREPDTQRTTLRDAAIMAAWAGAYVGLVWLVLTAFVTWMNS